MTVSILHNPFGTVRLGDFLQENLSSGTWTHFRAAIAFVKLSGVKHIAGQLAAFSARANVTLSVGVDSGGTSFEGLTALYKSIEDRGSLWVYHNPNRSTFHPKLYLFRNATEAILVVGSGNLTEGGLFTNYEASLGISLNLQIESERQFLIEVEQALDSWATAQDGLCCVVTPEFLAQLAALKYLPAEAETRDTEEGRRGAGEPGEPGEPTIFKRHAVPPAPAVARPPVEPAPGKKEVVEVNIAADSRERYLLYTEASYHYPQGTHLGHLLSVLWVLGLPTRKGTHFDDRFIRMRGDLSGGRVGNYQRQTKYKLQAAMELGIIEDDRIASGGNYVPALTPLGTELRRVLAPYLKGVDLSFSVDADGVPSSRMAASVSAYNELIRRASNDSDDVRRVVRQAFLNMPAVQHMMAYLYQISRQARVEKTSIYSDFFQAPFVREYCKQVGIEVATEESAKHRCPFLLNVLDALGVVRVETTCVTVQKMLLYHVLVKSSSEEADKIAINRVRAIASAWKAHADRLTTQDLTIARELFGADFLTKKYYLDTLEIWGA